MKGGMLHDCMLLWSKEHTFTSTGFVVMMDQMQKVQSTWLVGWYVWHRRDG